MIWKHSFRDLNNITKSFSVYNNGEGAYLSEHSSRQTLESNTGIETAVGHSSMFIGGGALALIFYLISPSNSSSENTSHSYTDTQIRSIYGTFFALNMLSFVIFACLPTKEYDSIASKSKTSMPTLKEQFGEFHSPVLCLICRFFIIDSRMKKWWIVSKNAQKYFLIERVT
ncbi:hypothetical protein COOONC_24882 [Cooperia oncophora]